MKPFSASFTLSNPSSSCWKILSIAGVGGTKSALDTLKKISSFGGFWQVFPVRSVASFSHLAWAAYSTVSSLESKSTHYSQPELEFLSRVSGYRQWKRAKEKAGVEPHDLVVVVAWVGPSTGLSESEFVRFSKKWGLKAKKVEWGADVLPPPHWGVDKSSFAFEQSALVEIE